MPNPESCISAAKNIADIVGHAEPAAADVLREAAFSQCPKISSGAPLDLLSKVGPLDSSTNASAKFLEDVLGPNPSKSVGEQSVYLHPDGRPRTPQEYAHIVAEQSFPPGATYDRARELMERRGLMRFGLDSLSGPELVELIGERAKAYLVDLPAERAQSLRPFDSDSALSAEKAARLAAVREFPSANDRLLRDVVERESLGERLAPAEEAQLQAARELKYTYLE